MVDQKMDFLNFQKDMMETSGIGFSKESYDDAIKKLYVLEFHIDSHGENIVSSIDGIIAFIERNYMGETISPGDIWLCSGTFRNTVYYVMPLKKITSSMIMGLSDGIRDEIIDALWKANRRQFEKIFEDRYKNNLYHQARTEARDESAKIIEGLQEKMKDLEKQLEHSRMIIDGRSQSDDSGVELFSEGMEPDAASSAPVVQAASQVQVVQVPVMAQAPEFSPASVYGQYRCAPGMPEMRYTDGMSFGGPSPKITVMRLAPETIQSDSFQDGKYFVHINPSKKFLVVRRHDYGSAVCIDKKIRLDGLGDYVPFSEKVQLLAEYDARYNGLIIRL